MGRWCEAGMRRGVLSSLRARLVLLVLLAVVPAFGVILYSAWQEHRHQVAHAQDDVLRLARFAAARHEARFEHTRELLVTLAEIPEVRAGDPAACSARLAALLPRYPEYANLGVISPGGDVFCSAVPLPGPVNVSGWPHVRRAVETRTLVIGEYQVGPISRRPVLPLLHPVPGPSGEVRSVVFGALDLGRIGVSGEEGGMPPRASLLAVAADGRILGRYPDPERWVGQLAVGAPAVEAILGLRGPGTVVAGGLDGVRRLFGVSPVRGPAELAGVRVGVGVPWELVTGATRATLARNLVGLLLIGIVTVAAAWVGGDVLVVRSERALMAAARRMAAGDLSARSGVAHDRGELGELARGFDEMAASIERRTAEHSTLAESLQKSEAQLRLAVEASDTGLWDWDLRTDSVHFSPQWKAQLGYRDDELPDRHEEWESRLHPDDRERMLATMRAYRAGPWSPYEAEFRLRRRDGSYRWILARGSPVRDAEGRPVRMLGSHIDVTERKRAEEVSRALAALGRELVEPLNVTEVARRVVASVCRLFEAGLAVLGRVDPVSGTQTCVAAAGVDRPETWIGLTLPAGMGTVGRAVAERRPILWPDVLADPRIERPEWTIERLGQEGSRSVMAAPLVARGETLGGLTLTAPPGRTFTETDLSLLDRFAGLAALALQTAELYEQTTRRGREAEALAEAGRLVVETLDFRTVAQRVADRVAGLLRAGGAVVDLFDAGSMTLEVVATSGGFGFLAIGFRLPVEATTIGQAVLERTPVVTPDVLADPRLYSISPELRARIEASGLHSRLTVPLVVRERVLGTLSVGDRAGRQFGDAEVRLLQAFADHAAAALDNARLFGEGRAAQAAAEQGRREAEVLARVAATLTESLTTSEVARRIGEHVRTLLTVPSTDLRLLQTDGSLVAVGALDPAGAHGGPGHVLQSGMGFPGAVAAAGAPVRTLDVLADPRVTLPDDRRRLILDTGYGARLGVPLRVMGGIIGVLSVADRTGREFTDAETVLLQTFADQAALAFTNAESYEEAERRRREAEVFADLTRELGASLDVDVVIEHVVEATRRLCGSDRVRVALSEPGSDPTVLGRWRGDVFPGWESFRVQPGKGAGGIVLATGRPFRTDCYAEDPRITKDYLDVARAEGTVALLVMPITFDGRIQGLVFAINRSPRPFTEREETLLVRLADHAAGALRNAQVFAERQRAVTELGAAHGELADRLRELMALWEASVGVGRFLDPRALGEHVIQTVERLLSYRRGSLWVVGGEGGAMELLAHSDVGLSGEALEAELDRVRGLVRLGEGITGWVAEHGEPVRTGDVRADPRYVEADPTVRSELCVPLVTGGRTVGCLNVESPEPDAFSEHDERLLTTLANPVAVALENARLYREIQLHSAELEQRVAERTASLTEANQEMAAFAYTISHDLRAPLRGIQGFAQALLEDYGARLDDTGRGYARRIAAAGARLDTLIQDLLAYSRLGRSEIARQPVNLELQVSAVLADMDGELRERGARLRVEGPIPPVLGHEVTLGQVLANLVANALTFVGPGVKPEVRIRAEPRGTRVRLWVEDNGIGITPAHHERIFGVFERLHGIERYPGTGIGLAIVRRGVERMGGTVGVESAVGRGSRFWIELEAAA
jgi:PAS domain S-box-containing protein